jgi:outer membrane protein assembly factor BamB
MLGNSIDLWACRTLGFPNAAICPLSLAFFVSPYLLETNMKLFIAGLVVCGTFGILVAADWPQFLGPDRDNVSSETGLVKTFGKEGPKKLWTIDVGPGFGGAAIEGGMVYILDRVGEKGDVLRCLDLATGEEKWSYAYDAPGKCQFSGSRSTPLVDKDYVYTIGMMGDMNCISKTTHKPVWTRQLLKEFGGQLPTWAVSQSPVAYKDTIIVAPLSKTAGVVALSRDKGAVVWKSDPIGTMQYPSPYVTTIDGVDQVIMISNFGQVTGIDAAKGAILWHNDKFECKIPIPSPLNVGDGRIFICGAYNGTGSMMLDVKKTGDKWSATPEFANKKFSSQNANPVLYKDYLYGNGGTSSAGNSGFQCMDLKGKIKWQTMPAKGDPTDFGLGNILLAGDVIFALRGDKGELVMIQPSPDGYKELARAKVLDAKGGTVWAPLAISDGKLIVRDQHQMKCFDVKADK